eukprot:scaffold1864_cov106-Isochrysis_galbana.AAC.9
MTTQAQGDICGMRMRHTAIINAARQRQYGNGHISTASQPTTARCGLSALTSRVNSAPAPVRESAVSIISTTGISSILERRGRRRTQPNKQHPQMQHILDPRQEGAKAYAAK